MTRLCDRRSKVIESDEKELGHLEPRRLQSGRVGAREDHHRRDGEPRAGIEIIKRTDNVTLVHGEPKLLIQLADGAFLGALAIMQPAPGEGHLARMPAHVGGALKDGNGGVPFVIQYHDRDCGGPEGLRRAGPVEGLEVCLEGTAQTTAP
jgi:hypothetical protein